jgi:hypothetical protein
MHDEDVCLLGRFTANALRMEAATSSKTSVNSYKTTRSSSQKATTFNFIALRI